MGFNGPCYNLENKNFMESYHIRLVLSCILLQPEKDLGMMELITLIYICDGKRLEIPKDFTRN
jgi:hypothetical protein